MGLSERYDVILSRNLKDESRTVSVVAANVLSTGQGPFLLEQTWSTYRVQNTLNKVKRLLHCAYSSDITLIACGQ